MISAPSTAGSILAPSSKSPVAKLDAVPGLVAAPTEHPHLTAGIPQERRDEASQRAGAAGEQDG
jgi:hypothetical protein